MIKTILVPATGSDMDIAIFRSALTLARAFAAHLEVLHVHVDAAALAATMASDAGGGATVIGLVDRIEEEAGRREAAATRTFREFCARERLVLADAPIAQGAPSAQWLRQTGDEAYWVAELGRSADLLIIGRRTDDPGVSVDTIETALLGSGRPVLISPAAGLAAPPETIVIAWKETPEAARAVGAAMPLLSTAKQILIVTVAEDQGLSEEGTRLLTSLRWHGFNVSLRRLPPGPQGAAGTLLAAAAEQDALVVMGAYGHSRLRQWIFGGFTRHVLRGAEVPVLMMH
ncbi:MAG: universal stress protein [Alphaproteobacteria bacterium]|nr:universal stress protein [Alphaproteobacteria bacterium]